MSAKGISAAYADFITELSYAHLPGEVVVQAKERILDTIGVSLAGYALIDFPRLVIDWVRETGGIEQATIIRTVGKFPAVNAALANGACAHGIDMDDGHRFGALHPGAVVVPAAIAAAEITNASTEQLIAGVVAGYDVMIRIGMAINPSSLRRGFHATGIAGVFGAASAAAAIMKLDHDQTKGALGLAGLQASGLLEVNHDDIGARVKPINPARAASSGLMSAIFAKKGAFGPAAIFEGEGGFFRAVADEVKEDLLTRGLGHIYEITNTYIKFYASCRHTHSVIDAALAAGGTGPVRPEQIDKIRVETYQAAITLAGIVDPSTVAAARFSITFSVALALTKGNAGADQYSEENVRDVRIHELAHRVELSVGERWEKVYPQERGAGVTIYWNDGRITKSEVALAKGEPENPASSDEIYRKFEANAQLSVSASHARQLGNVILDLENHPLGDFVALLNDPG